jgi:hypothetical protein
MLPAGERHAWKPEWLALLDLVQPAIPAHWAAIVLTDRGLYARWLYRAIVSQHWHPFMRINHQGTFHPAGSDRRQAIGAFVPTRGSSWAGAGSAFKGPERRLGCTLLTCWEDGHTGPRCILTDLAPQECAIGWYGLRNWIEQDFRTKKRGFWHWEHTKMTDPARAERVWLPMALCTFKLLSLGDAVERDAALPRWGTATGTRPRGRATRLVRLGWLALLAAQATARPLPRITPLSPDAWPDWPPPAARHHPSTKAVA